MGVGRQIDGSRRAVFLDRDGVINRAIVRDGKPFSPANVRELEVPPEVAPALARLRGRGFLLVVATNQPDVASGEFKLSDVDAIHSELARTLPLDDIFVCFHNDADHCDCRKPLPGLIVQAARRYGIDLPGSFLIGDRWRDVAAGQAAGVRTVFIDYAYDERRPEPAADVTVADLTAAVDWIESVITN